MTGDNTPFRKIVQDQIKAKGSLSRSEGQLWDNPKYGEQWPGIGAVFRVSDGRRQVVDECRGSPKDR
jgi:hypothetical protein